ncbi:MAG: hypothetical protein JXR37_14965 [Kiritimatiellae bacterium]|nr:hypothetical protein [Kiritimatiellia bacterium]
MTMKITVIQSRQIPGADAPAALTAELDLAKWREVRANGERMQAVYRVRRQDLYGTLGRPYSA